MKQKTSIMSKFFELLKKHWIALVLAVLMGLLFLSYHILAINLLGDAEYQPVTIKTHYDIAVLYAPRAQAVYSGQTIAGDISLYEYQNGPAFLPIINPIIMALLVKFTGSMKKALIFSDFVFPALVFIMVYLFALKITKRKYLSLFFSFIFVLNPRIGEFNQYSLLKPFTPFLNFGRFDHPQITFIFFVPAMYFIYRAITEKNKISIILAGVCSGLLFYTYFYDWVYVFTGLFLLFVIFLIQKNFAAAKIIIYIGCIALAVSVLYWINFLTLSSLPQYKDIVARVGVEVSNQFRFTNWRAYLRHIILALLIWFAFSKKQKVLTAYLIAFLLPLLILLNIQVITGFNPQSDHWSRTHWLILGTAILMLFIWLYEKYFKKIPKKYFLVLGSSIMAVVSIITINTYIKMSALNYDKQWLPPQILTSYTWLSQNTPQGSVVGSISYITNAELLLYTENKVFLPYGLNTLAPTDEIWERFFYISKLFNFPEEQFSKSISENQGMLMHLFHCQYYVDKSLNSFFKKNKRELPEKLFKEKMDSYKEILNKPDNLIIPYKLDYIYFGPREKELSENLKISYPFLDKVYDDDYIQIYKVTERTKLNIL